MISRNLLIQGIGCTETGARIVLHELLKTVPAGTRCIVVCTTETAVDFIGKTRGRMSGEVYLLGLSHRVWGRYLRVVLEAVIALCGLFRLVGRVVNLSHYGLCLGGDYVLYIHSPLLMDGGAADGVGEGRSNKLKRSFLNSCIKRARLIVLQTRGMKRQLDDYCSRHGLRSPPNKVLRPKVTVPEAGIVRRNFAFQLFYPASRFAHKRVDLAINASVAASARNRDVGLVITTIPDEGIEPRGVLQVGRISREEVYNWLRGSDVMLFTSERETLGLPLLEALALGVPVIAPDLPYARELLGDAGCYFSEPTVSSVEAAINRCVSELPAWQTAVRQRAIEVGRDAASWPEHWVQFIGSHDGAQDRTLPLVML